MPQPPTHPLRRLVALSWLPWSKVEVQTPVGPWSRRPNPPPEAPWPETAPERAAELERRLSRPSWAEIRADARRVLTFTPPPSLN